MRVEAVTAEPFPIPLIEPFVISRASVSSTHTVIVRATASRGDARATGYGEAALPLGSTEEPHELVSAIRAAATALARDAPSLGGRRERVAAQIVADLDGPGVDAPHELQTPHQIIEAALHVVREHQRFDAGVLSHLGDL